MSDLDDLAAISQTIRKPHRKAKPRGKRTSPILMFCRIFFGCTGLACVGLLVFSSVLTVDGTGLLVQARGAAFAGLLGSIACFLLSFVTRAF